MIGLLLAMYPARWRSRYGEEFRAVLESRPLGPFDVADVLIGALDARLTRSRIAGAAEIRGGHHVLLRLGGIGAIVGGSLWFVGLAAAGQSDGDDGLWGPVLSAGTLGLLVALVGLSAFQAQKHPLLAWAAFAIPGVGTILSMIGLTAMRLWPDGGFIFGSVTPWHIWFIGMFAMLVGSMIFAIATIRAAVFSRLAAVGLAVSSALVFLVGFGAAGTGSGEDAIWVFAIAAGCFALSWIALGVMALRRGPIRAIVPA